MTHSILRFYLPFFLFMVIAITASVASIAQTTGDEIVGKWWNQERDAQIQIYKEGTAYAGKIIWLKEPIDSQTGQPRLDKFNPEKTLRSRPVLGMNLMNGFIFSISDKQWTGGKIYDGRSGKTYKCYLTLNKDNSLKVRGYIGAVWMGLGQTNTWQKIN